MYVFVMVFLLVAASAHAQTNSTTASQVDGTANCRSINVGVNQTIQNGGSNTTLHYVVRDSCANTLIAEGFGPIPASAYKTQQTTHALLATTQHGTISLTWRATHTQQQTFTSTATERQNGNLVRRVQEDQFFSSATADGNVLGIPVSAGDRPATMSQITQTTR
jgi:hypothetical protein